MGQFWPLMEVLLVVEIPDFYRSWTEALLGTVSATAAPSVASPVQFPCSAFAEHIRFTPREH
jgi:hypothetical protein